MYLFHGKQGNTVHKIKSVVLRKVKPFSTIETTSTVTQMHAFRIAQEVVADFPARLQQTETAASVAGHIRHHQHLVHQTMPQ